MNRAAVALAAAIAFALAAGHASASPNSSASCVATISSFEAHLAPGFVGNEVSGLAPVGEIASNLATAHLGTFEACRAAEG